MTEPINFWKDLEDDLKRHAKEKHWASLYDTPADKIKDALDEKEYHPVEAYWAGMSDGRRFMAQHILMQHFGSHTLVDL